MTSSLSSLVNNLSKGIRKIKCNFGLDNKGCETCRRFYPYEYMDDWEDSMKHHYLKKEGFTVT